jgi:hypothetical protein
MNFLSNPVAARALWAAPALMAVIAVALLVSGLDQRATAIEGTDVQAEVVDIEVRERSEITRGAVTLRYTPPEAAAPVERTVELPLAFLKEIEQDLSDNPDLVLPIRVREGSDQISLGAFERVQWVMTLAFSGMALMGAIGLVLLVGAWNRYLAREGDPALRHLDGAAAEASGA